MANLPFNSVDNPQLRRLLEFLRPVLKNKLPHATKLKEIVEAEFDKARERFKNELKVRFTMYLLGLKGVRVLTA